MSWDFIRDACAGTFDPKFQNQLTVANDWVVLAPDKLTIISGKQAGGQESSEEEVEEDRFD